MSRSEFFKLCRSTPEDRRQNLHVAVASDVSVKWIELRGARWPNGMTSLHVQGINVLFIDGQDKYHLQHLRAERTKEKYERWLALWKCLNNCE